ncbi:hypothetical protein JQ615_05295 [Bradyrhizobium jicamae]|uniref:Uncharacterized protein n=1 Tax=Bradyrhizobium jicamae TaxID=280332 RepID=A0ABS5FDE1_9BRAD|nr:hypothetical protein [Bradyrhizobium jicamae]MBR0794808.1 hypothetical protein [Bradyrhizobium jicamae]
MLAESVSRQGYQASMINSDCDKASSGFGGSNDLTRTGRWKDPDSADRYKHTMASTEAGRADLLPVPAPGTSTSRRSKKAV